MRHWQYMKVFLCVAVVCVFVGLILTLGGEKSLLYGIMLTHEPAAKNEILSPISAEQSEEREGGLRFESSRRNLFKAPVTSKPKNVRSGYDDAAAAAKDLTLVGILDDGKRKAIIKDTKTSQTYFLGVDDVISQMRIVEIGEGEVVLGADGERYTLVL